jgi:DNA-binding NarL/FixJ family response regulator
VSGTPQGPPATHASPAGVDVASWHAARRGYAPEPLSVLLVEDSPVLAERLREALGAMPAVGEVRTVDRETAAIDALAGADVVVLDLHLKQGTGFGVLRALRDRPEPPPVVIVFTNHDVPGYRTRAASLGAGHFLDKARDFDRLGDLLREVHLARSPIGSA